MSRIKVLENGEFTGAWFNPDTAADFEESTYHDGHNWISKATGSQWHHERLYYTASKRWIISKWSNVQGSEDTNELISEEDAAIWFIKNEYSDNSFNGLPENVTKIIIDHMNALEI